MGAGDLHTAIHAEFMQRQVERRSRQHADVDRRRTSRRHTVSQRVRQQLTAEPVVSTHGEACGLARTPPCVCGYGPADRMRHLCVELFAYNASDIILTEDGWGDFHITSQSCESLNDLATESTENTEE